MCVDLVNACNGTSSSPGIEVIHHLIWQARHGQLSDTALIIAVLAYCCFLKLSHYTKMFLHSYEIF